MPHPSSQKITFPHNILNTYVMRFFDKNLPHNKTVAGHWSQFCISSDPMAVNATQRDDKVRNMLPFLRMFSF